MLTLQEIVDFSLGRAASCNSSGEGGASLFDGSAGGLDSFFLGFYLSL